MRNHYESEVGYFKNALLPDVETFREALPLVEKMLEDQKDKHIIMYCTGGIRCEKASAYYKHKGFKNVYQVEGGVIEYTRRAQALGIENKFLGKNFVFDERRGEKISKEIVSKCHQCGEPCDTHVIVPMMLAIYFSSNVQIVLKNTNILALPSAKNSISFQKKKRKHCDHILHLTAQSLAKAGIKHIIKMPHWILKSMK